MENRKYNKYKNLVLHDFDLILMARYDYLYYFNEMIDLYNIIGRYGTIHMSNEYFFELPMSLIISSKVQYKIDHMNVIFI